MRRGKRLAFPTILLAVLCGSAAADSSGTVAVSGKSNIFAAGRTTAFNGTLPPSFRFTSGAGQVLSFSSVTGTVTGSPTSGANGPDGGAGLPTNINSYQGISGIVHTTSSLFLVGVFLDDSTPADPAPARLTFTDDSFTSLSPALRQVFFVGDGHTPGATLHQFNVPATATRLFLGFADAYAFQGNPGYYDDNGGSFTATFQIVPAGGGGGCGTSPLTVGAKSNIYAAGRAAAFSGVLPPCYQFTAGAGQVLAFSSVTGTVSPNNQVWSGPDGNTYTTNISSYQGISGIKHISSNGRAMFLVGVFLTDATPADPAPGILDFSNRDNFTTLSPLIAQTFFIGDGLTGTGSGAQQQFVVPATATRLFLGFANGRAFAGAPGYYDEGVGSLTAAFQIGPGGGGTTCTYTLDSVGAIGPATGGTGSVNVSTASGCAWTATSEVNWITITSGASGTGSGTVIYSVAVNTGSSSRTGNLTIAGQTYPVTQEGAGAGCSYAIAPSSASAPAEGTTGNIAVATAAGCSWTATSSVAWITITSGASGTGSGAVSYTVAANTSTSSRTGTLTIAGQTFTVTQAGGAPSCNYAIAPASASVPAAASTGTVAVATASGCAWTATSSVNWITITSGASGSGSGAVSYTVAANTSTSSRTGTLTIAGQTFTVTQAGGTPSCNYAIAPASASVPAAASTGTVAVATASGCSWTATSSVNWITITSGASGTGSGSVNYTVAANSSTSSRTGTLTIAGQTFTVTQAAGAAGPQPVINDGGVVNAADYTANFAPGIIFSTFGKNLASGTRAATSVPLPASLDGVSVEVIDGSTTLVAPLFFVSAGQINAQLPFDITGTSVQVRVRTAQGVSNAQTISVSARAPRLFTQTLTGAGEAIVLHADYTLVTADNPASPSETLILYLTGLGAVSPSIAAGQAGGDGTVARPLNLVKDEVQVQVNGNAAVVYFAGLAPYFVGLYQINFKVPEDTPYLPALLTVRVGWQESQSDVGFRCDRKWQAVASAPIGLGGGALTAGQLTLTVPAGGLASSSEIKVAQAAAEADPQPDRGSPVYRITGLPATTSTPITVSIVATGPVSPDSTYIVVEEPYGGEMFLKAQVEGNRATVTLPPRQGVPLGPAANSPSNQALMESAPRPADESSTEASALLVFLMLNVRTKLSSEGWFEVFYTAGSLTDAQAESIANALQGGAFELWELGLSPPTPWAATRTPVTVGSSCDGLEYWGCVRRSSWNGETSVRLDYQWITRAGQRKLTGEADPLGVFAGHLTVHLVLQLQNPNLPFTRHPWLWLDEALAACVERPPRILQWSAWEKYVPYQLKSTAWVSIWRTGLEFPPQLSPPAQEDKSQEGVRYHGYWASTFIHHLYSPDFNGVTSWLHSLYGSRPSAGEGLTPLEALQKDLQSRGADLGQEWVSFWEKFAGGIVYPPDGARDDAVAPLMMAYARGADGLIDDFAGKAANRTIYRSWPAPDLSAIGYLVAMPDSWPKKSTLTISATGGALILIRELIPGKQLTDPFTVGARIGAASSRRTIDLDTFTPGNDLLVVVVNPRAVKPFRSTTPVVIEFALKAETADTSWVNSLNAIRTMALPALKCVTSGPAGVCGALWSGHIETWPNKTAFGWTGSRDFAYTGPDYQAGTVSLNGRVSEQLDKLESLHFEHSWAQDPYTFSVVVTIRNLDGGPNPAPTTLDYTVTKSNLRNNLSFHLPEFRYTITNKDGTPGPAVEIDWDRSATYPIEVRLYKF